MMKSVVKNTPLHKSRKKLSKHTVRKTVAKKLRAASVERQSITILSTTTFKSQLTWFRYNVQVTKVGRSDCFWLWPIGMKIFSDDSSCCFKHWSFTFQFISASLYFCENWGTFKNFMLDLTCGNITFLIGLNETCEQRRKASKPARWNNFVDYIIDKRSCELARVFRKLWSFLIICTHPQLERVWKLF